MAPAEIRRRSGEERTGGENAIENEDPPTGSCAKKQTKQHVLEVTQPQATKARRAAKQSGVLYTCHPSLVSFEY